MNSLKGHPIIMYTVLKYGTLNRTRYTAVMWSDTSLGLVKQK